MNNFQKTLADHQLQLTRAETSTLQVNVGHRCNLNCRHCHVNAGPERSEVMNRETMEAVVRFARTNNFEAIDVTGGAPELVPDIGYLLEELTPLTRTLMMRTNLIALLDENRSELLALCRRLKITLIASFPSVNQRQADSQRGNGIWEKSIAMLQRLNELGWGRKGSGLELHLVSNPAGAFMPATQCAAEKKFKTDLARKWDIEFTSLFTFANVPLGRFRDWLASSGNLDNYLDKLRGSFNPDTINGLMCRNLINVSWDGYLFDCDFNMAARLPYSGKNLHVSQVASPKKDQPIMTDDYCFACTAGSGFT